MRIDVITIAKCEPPIGTPYLAVSVMVYGCTDIGEAVKAIKNTEPKGETWQAFIDLKEQNDYQAKSLKAARIKYEGLLERYKACESDYQLAFDKWTGGKKRITELQEENETLMHNNRELLHQLNTIGNNICKLANDLDDYVPF